MELTMQLGDEHMCLEGVCSQGLWLAQWITSFAHGHADHWGAQIPMNVSHVCLDMILIYAWEISF